MTQSWDVEKFLLGIPTCNLGAYSFVGVKQDSPGEFTAFFEPTTAIPEGLTLEEARQEVNIRWSSEREVLSFFQMTETTVPVSALGGAVYHVNGNINPVLLGYLCKVSVASPDLFPDSDKVVLTVGCELGLFEKTVRADESMEVLRKLAVTMMLRVVIEFALAAIDVSGAYAQHIREKH